MQHDLCGMTAAILGVMGVFILASGVFHILPVPASTVALMALACFIIAVVIKRIGKNSCP